MPLCGRTTLLGICRGIQLLNVYFGGTLFQDLPTQHPQGIDHRLPPASARPVHTVELVTGTPLHDLLHREKLPVNSTHHQAIRRLAPRLEVMALSEDGLIEAVYLPDYRFVWGVQWHPELNYAEEASSRRILDAFAHACQLPAHGCAVRALRPPNRTRPLPKSALRGPRIARGTPDAHQDAPRLRSCPLKSSYNGRREACDCLPLPERQRSMPC